METELWTTRFTEEQPNRHDTAKVNKTQGTTKIKTTLRLHFNSKIVFKFFTIYIIYLHLCHIYIYIYIYKKHTRLKTLKSFTKTIFPPTFRVSRQYLPLTFCSVAVLDSEFPWFKHTLFTLFLSANWTVTSCSQPSARPRFHLISIMLLTPSYG